MLNATEIYSSLSPQLATLDVERIRLRNNLYPINVLFPVLLLGGGATLYWLLDNGQDDTLDWYVPTFLITAFFTLIIWAFSRYHYKKKFKELFIAEIVPKIISSLGNDFTYDYKKHISVTEVRDSLLFPKFTKFHSEDLVRGTIDGVTLKFAEIKLVEEKSKSEGSGTNYSTIFEGIYFNASLPVTFPTSIWLVTRYFVDTLKSMRVDEVKLDHNRDSKYRCYSEEPEVAQTVLRPFILDKIDDLNHRLKSDGIVKKPLLYRFSKNRVQMAMETKHGLFEPRLSKTINSQEFIEKQTNILNAIAGLLNELTLN